MRWVATLIDRPEIKMKYALLLISETQGVGKGTLGERILAPIIGKDNTSAPSEATVCDSDYTYWQAHKRLAVINEIYAGHSSKAYNKLKSLITDPTITVKKKFLAEYDIENWMHILACSNNFNALKLTTDDRRWLIPKVTEKKKDESYWIQFNNWLTEEGGLGIIMHWAKEFLKTNKPVGRAEDAPWTAAKLVVIEAGDSPGMEMVANVLNSIKSQSEHEGDEFYRTVMMDADLVGLIKDNIDRSSGNYLERPATIRTVAKRCGWFISEEKTRFRDGTQGRLICSDADDAKRPPHELFQEVIPTRIRRLGKDFLVIDELTGKLNINSRGGSREALDDPLAVEAKRKAKEAEASRRLTDIGTEASKG